MAARRCSTCSINYPMQSPYMLCKACGEKTDPINESDPDDNWQELVDQYHGVYIARDLPGLSRDHLVEHGGQTWVADAHLRDVGYYHAGVGTIIRVIGLTSRSLFFEINGRAMRLSGESTHTPQVRGWWLARVEDEGWVPDAPPLP